jgi:hypothetical protein
MGPAHAPPGGPARTGCAGSPLPVLPTRSSRPAPRLRGAERRVRAGAASAAGRRPRRAASPVSGRLRRVHGHRSAAQALTDRRAARSGYRQRRQRSPGAGEGRCRYGPQRRYAQTDQNGFAQVLQSAGVCCRLQRKGCRGSHGIGCGRSQRAKRARGRPLLLLLDGASASRRTRCHFQGGQGPQAAAAGQSPEPLRPMREQGSHVCWVLLLRCMSGRMKRQASSGARRKAPWVCAALQSRHLARSTRSAGKGEWVAREQPIPAVSGPRAHGASYKAAGRP